jgi:hypothetical protein
VEQLKVGNCDGRSLLAINCDYCLGNDCHLLKVVERPVKAQSSGDYVGLRGVCLELNAVFWLCSD